MKICRDASGGADAVNINMLRAIERGNGRMVHIHVQSSQRVMQRFDIGREDFFQNVCRMIVLADIGREAELFVSCQLSGQQKLKLRIPGKAQRLAQTNDHGFDCSGVFRKLCGRHRHDLFIVLQDIIREQLLPIGQIGIFCPDRGKAWFILHLKLRSIFNSYFRTIVMR